MIYSPSEYSFVRFEKSRTQHKKYDAILKNKKTKQEKRIPFGDSRYEQYEDKTPLKLYSSKNHKDSKRRAAYRQRHAGEGEAKYSAGYFAWYYLW